MSVSVRPRGERWIPETAVKSRSCRLLCLVLRRGGSGDLSLLYVTVEFLWLTLIIKVYNRYRCEYIITRAFLSCPLLLLLLLSGDADQEASDQKGRKNWDYERGGEKSEQPAGPPAAW